MKRWHGVSSGATKWPLAGTFDLNYCDRIEAELRRKDLKNDKKHQNKKMNHAEQRDVLQYFKIEGTQKLMALQQKTEQNKTKPTAPVLKAQSLPPPYTSGEEARQFPVREIDGRILGKITVEVRETEGQKQDTLTQPKNRPGETLTASQSSAQKTMRHCQGSCSLEDLNHSQNSEQLAENLDREGSEHDSEAADLDHDMTLTPSKKRLLREKEENGGQQQHSAARHSTPARLALDPNVFTEFSRLMEKLEESQKPCAHTLPCEDRRGGTEWLNCSLPGDEQLRRGRIGPWEMEFREQKCREIEEKIESGKATCEEKEWYHEYTAQLMGNAERP